MHFTLMANFNHRCKKPAAQPRRSCTATCRLCLRDLRCILIKCYLLSWQVREAGFPAKVSDKMPIRDRRGEERKEKRQRKKKRTEHTKLNQKRNLCECEDGWGGEGAVEAPTDGGRRERMWQNAQKK